MKKILVLFVMLLGLAFTSQAENNVTKFRTTALSFRSVDANGNWTEWSEWESCNVLVVINVEKDLINIYSATPQEFDIYEAGDGFEKDAKGGETWTLKCVDADGLRCEVRIRIQSDGQTQLYVDYSDLSYVYAIEAR